MSVRSSDSAATPFIHLDELLGREVRAANNRPIGRLEEFRAKPNGSGLTIEEYVIGVSGLFERLGMAVGLIIGHAPGGGYVARWDQLDISNPKRPRLKCPLEELRRR